MINAVFLQEKYRRWKESKFAFCGKSQRVSQ